MSQKLHPKFAKSECTSVHGYGITINRYDGGASTVGRWLAEDGATVALMVAFAPGGAITRKRISNALAPLSSTPTRPGVPSGGPSHCRAIGSNTTSTRLLPGELRSRDASAIKPSDTPMSEPARACAGPANCRDKGVFSKAVPSARGGGTAAVPGGALVILEGGALGTAEPGPLDAIANDRGAACDNRSGNAPGEASVPEMISAGSVSGRATLRTTRGVISNTISVLVR